MKVMNVTMSGANFSMAAINSVAFRLANPCRSMRRFTTCLQKSILLPILLFRLFPAQNLYRMPINSRSPRPLQLPRFPAMRPVLPVLAALIKEVCSFIGQIYYNNFKIFRH